MHTLRPWRLYLLPRADIARDSPSQDTSGGAGRDPSDSFEDLALARRVLLAGSSGGGLCLHDCVSSAVVMAVDVGKKLSVRRGD
jgi:hypothetical protein